MKKRMFITTIVMMLVLAVALTTSSLAWFSSANTEVTASAATFKAQAAVGNNVNLQISDSTSGWTNSISLNKNTGETMRAVIPTDALIAKDPTGYGDNPTYVPGKKDGDEVAVSHANLVWPAIIDFNEAKAKETSPGTFNFVIDGDNGVDTYSLKATTNAAYKIADHAAKGVYYEEFYIKNADTLQTITSLTFQVTGSMKTQYQIDNSTGEAKDKTCNGFAAFIVYDSVAVTAGDAYPVRSYEYAVDPTGTVSEGVGYVWVPFAAFSFAMDQTSGNTDKNAVAWQFADLDHQTSNEYDYNGIDITTLTTQNYDAQFGNTNDDGFVLNSANLQKLNSKVLGSTGSVELPAQTTDYRDTTSTFSMAPTKVYKVAFYFWLDGKTLDSDADTTVAQDVAISITASGATANANP